MQQRPLDEAVDRPDSLSFASWNIKSGGFNAYDPGQEVPERGAAIQRLVSDLHTERGISAVSLIDAYRWDEVYGGNIGIATHLGYQAASFVRIEDERLNRDNGRGIGIAFATDQQIEAAQPLDLDTRQGLSIILGIGKYGLQLAVVYLDDLSRDVRKQQLRALGAHLEPDMPTIVEGDFNLLRADMKGASLLIKAEDMAVRSLSAMLPRGSRWRAPIREMNKREEIAVIESLGLKDADQARKRPTWPARHPVFGVDYVFYNSMVNVHSFDVLPINGASDHRPILATVSVTA